jgi:hypothetical protein
MLFFVFLSLVAMFDLLVWCERRLSAVAKDVHQPLNRSAKSPWVSVPNESVVWAAQARSCAAFQSRMSEPPLVGLLQIEDA